MSRIRLSNRPERQRRRQERALGRLMVATPDYDWDGGKHDGRAQNKPDTVAAAIDALAAKGVRIDDPEPGA